VKLTPEVVIKERGSTINLQLIMRYLINVDNIQRVNRMQYKGHLLTSQAILTKGPKIVIFERSASSESSFPTYSSLSRKVTPWLINSAGRGTTAAATGGSRRAAVHNAAAATRWWG